MVRHCIFSCDIAIRLNAKVRAPNSNLIWFFAFCNLNYYTSGLMTIKSRKLQNHLQIFSNIQARVTVLVTKLLLNRMTDFMFFMTTFGRSENRLNWEYLSHVKLYARTNSLYCFIQRWDEMILPFPQLYCYKPFSFLWYPYKPCLPWQPIAVWRQTCNRANSKQNHSKTLISL